MGKSGLHGVKRHSMLGVPKYRHREERKKILKMCVKKLRSIDDPETFLCRSVLINNTLKQIQAFHKEASRHIHQEEDQRLREEEEEVEDKEEEEEVQADNSDNDESNDVSVATFVKEDDSKSSVTIDTNSHSLPHSVTFNSFGGHYTDMKQDSAYNAEDILSDILMPPPLSPRLEDITDCRLDHDFSMTESSGLLSNSWGHDETLDWAGITTDNAVDDKWADDSAEDLKTTIDVSVIKDICDDTEAVVPNKDTVDECFDDSSDSSSDASGTSEDRTSSDGENNDFEFGASSGAYSTCSQTSYMTDMQTVVLNSLIASLES